VRDVHAEAVDAAVEPEAQHVVEQVGDLGVIPVEVGLCGVEEVEVPLLGVAAGGDSCPGRAAEVRLPVVGRQLAVVAASVAEDVAGPSVRPGACRKGGLEPRVLVGRVVRHEVDDDLHAGRVCGGQEVIEVGEGPEERVDVAVVGDVVSGISLGRDVERREPDRIDAEVAEIGDLGGESREITDAVAVGVGERARVDLVDDGISPPLGVRFAVVLRAASSARDGVGQGAHR
jgi:hypothetical protein